MNVTEKRETFRAAVELLVQREVAEARPKHPGAYAGSVRSRLLNDTRDAARALLDGHDLTPEALADALDDTPEVPASAPTVRLHSDLAECSTCGCYGGGGWLPTPGRDELGMVPDPEPCPDCAVDRHRRHRLPGVAADRETVHGRLRQVLARRHDEELETQ